MEHCELNMVRNCLLLIAAVVTMRWEIALWLMSHFSWTGLTSPHSNSAGAHHCSSSSAAKLPAVVVACILYLLMTELTFSNTLHSLSF